MASASATPRSIAGGSTIKVSADYFVFAMPVEDVIDLITPEMMKAEPALAHLFTLDDITEWMNGIQIYLTEDVPLAHGHTIYVDSPWALTSISQAQFWEQRRPERAWRRNRERASFRWTSPNGSRRG